MARSQYGLPKSRSDDPRGMEGYIREAARKNGVDPDVAVRVAKSEGLRRFNSGVRRKDGTEEPSYGAFQLYTGGGLGNKFQKETGLDPKDPANEKATIDFAMKEAAKTGWGPWHGAKNTGIGEFEGISGGVKTAAAETAAPAGPGGIGSDAVASERANRMAGTDTSTTTTTTPDTGASQTATGPATGDWLAKLQDPAGNANQGLATAIQGLGQAVASTGLAKPPAAAPISQPVPVAMPSAPPVVPMVDPQVAANQRQQLAAAMQQLNSATPQRQPDPMMPLQRLNLARPV